MRSAGTMVDAIALSSPSGHMSKRARKAAEQRLCMELFGTPTVTLAQLKGTPSPKPPEQERAEKIARLREYATMAGPRQAKKLLAEAAQLEKGLCVPTDTKGGE